MVTCRYAKFNRSNSNITSGGLGTMGFALPAAIGTAFGDPSRPTVAIIGDGGFQMTLQELGTIMQFKPHVKIVILNNQFLGMVRQWAIQTALQQCVIAVMRDDAIHLG